MTGHRHATDRKDWTIVAECSNDPDHLAVEAFAEWIDAPTAPSEETYWDDTRHFEEDDTE